MIPLARLSYPKLYVPEAVKGAERDENPRKRYGCVLLIPKSDKATYKLLKDYIDELKAKPPLKGTKLKADKVALRDGDDDDETEECRGHWILSANRAEKQGPPGVVDRKLKPITQERNQREEVVYAGCWVKAYVGLFVPSGFVRISCGLEALQFIKDDEPFGNKVRAEDVFSALEDEEEEEEEEEEGEDDDRNLD